MLSILDTYQGDPNSRYLLMTQTGFIIFASDRLVLQKQQEMYRDRNTMTMVCKNTPEKLEAAKRWSSRVHFA
jgi:hypothetical protein